MAAHLDTCASAVARIWRAHGLKPHRVESFKLSIDTHFIEKLEDIVGLYLDPPEHVLVLCCNEKTQIQALDRTQPGLPLKRGPSEIHADLTVNADADISRANQPSDLPSNLRAAQAPWPRAETYDIY